MIAMGAGNHGEQYALTFEVMRRLGLSSEEVWMHYHSMGGCLEAFEVGACLHGLVRLPAVDRDMIAHAVNELYDDICRGGRAPYSTELVDRPHDE